MNHYKELNFEVVGVSDIWKRRREEGAAIWKEKMQNDVKAYRNNEELYDSKTVDAVFISTADFQHARHTIEAVKPVAMLMWKNLLPKPWKITAPP
jgi:predicted dehydrogenase